MPKIVLTPRELIKILEKDGFRFIRQNGSHAVYRDYEKSRKVIVPIHNKDIPTGTLHQIIKDGDIDISQHKKEKFE